MPIPFGVAPPLTPPPVSILPTFVPSEAYLLTWNAPDGTNWPLSDPSVGWHVLDSVVGLLGAAPITMTVDSDPVEGANMRNIHADPRLITLPLRIDGPKHLTFLTSSRNLGRSIVQTRQLGPGTLTLLQPDGSFRYIPAYYQMGFDPAPGNMSGWLYGDYVLTLFCPSPFWIGPPMNPVIRKFVGGDPKSFFNPYLSLTSAQTLGDTDIDNPGDVDAWPTITINGPASGATLTNNRTGQSFSIDPNATGIAHGDLLLGESVTITTRPGRVRGPDGSIWTAALNRPNAVLWPLKSGINPVTFALAGAGDGSSIVLNYSPRYEMA